MEQPLVSVIIPTYNRAEFLREAIESVLAQTYPHFELLILDNCSPDNTPEVVASFSDPRIKYLRHQCNIGAIANWTYGIYWAQGKYLSILGDDDQYLAEFLAHRLEAFAKDTDIVSVFGPYVLWDGNNRSDLSTTHESIGGQCTAEVFCELQAVEMAISTQFIGASMYRTSCAQAIWNLALIGGKTMDSAFNLLMAKCNRSKVACTNGTDLLYRQHAHQDSSTNKMEVTKDGATMFRIFMDNETDWNTRRIIETQLVNYACHNATRFWRLGEKFFAAKCLYFPLKGNPFNLFIWSKLMFTLPRMLLIAIKLQITSSS